MRILKKKLQNQLNHINLEEGKNPLDESSITEQIDLAMSSSNQSEDYKRYRELKPEQKIQCLFSEDDMRSIEEEFAKYSN